MLLIPIQDRSRLAAYLQRDLPLFLYSLGDLDDFFYPNTRWYGWQANEALQAVILRYTAAEPEVLLALAPEADRPALKELLRQLRRQLPLVFYAHLSPGMESTLRPLYQLQGHGLHWKMQLENPALLPPGPFPQVAQLERADDARLRELYDRHYPDHAYDPRMLSTGQYFGIWAGNRLVCAAGVHVYSPAYGVAALGNVVTHHQHRGRGLARQTVTLLCRSLLQHVQHIVLNVKADNQSAIRLYQSLGFVKKAEYYEYTASRSIL